LLPSRAYPSAWQTVNFPRTSAAVWIAGIALAALVVAVAVLALTSSSGSDGDSGGGGGGGGSGGDPSAELLRQSEGERRIQGWKLAARDVTTSERLGIKATDVSEEAGIYEYSRTYGSLALDFNDDGWDDLLVNRHYFAYLRLYRNERNGTFADVTGIAIPQSQKNIRDPHGCAADDVNQDGRLDIFCTSGGVHGTAPNRKTLWIQRGNGTFSSQAREYGVEDRWGRGRVATFVDANGDAYPDLFHGTEPERSDGERSPNRLFINEGGERFRNAPEYGVTRTEGANTVQAADFDRDGREDLLLCSEEAGIRLYRNVANERYQDVADDVNADAECGAAAFGDIDGDSRLDLIYLGGGGLHVRAQRGGRFERFYDLDVSDTVALALGDVDADGLADIYVVRRGPRDADYEDLMLVNRGEGRFVNMLLPRIRRGEGESVTAIDYDRNGHTDFVVENGKGGTEGWVSLIAFSPLNASGGS
jgi:FG-GAP-like repeat